MNRSLQTILAIGLVLAIGVPLWVFVIAREPQPRQAPPRDLGPVPVETRVVQPVDLPLELEVFGNLEPRARMHVTAEVGGRVERVHPGWSAGGLVREGELLFALEETPFRLEVDAARASLAEVEAGTEGAAVETERARLALEKAREQRAVAVREHERMARLADEGAASESLADRALATRLDAELAEQSARSALQAATAAHEAARARTAAARTALARAEDRLARSRVHASFSGRLTSRPPPVGTLIAPGQTLGELLDVTHLLLVVQVPEAELLRLRPGLEVAITLPGPPETEALLEVTGVVESLPAHTDPVTRHGALEIAVANPYADPVSNGEAGVSADGPKSGVAKHPAFLPAGVFGHAVVDLGVARGALWIDRRHFDWRDGEPVAFVVVDEGEGTGVARRRPLVFEREYGEGFLVAEGLRPGERLILGPLDRLVDGTACRPRAAEDPR